MSRKKYLKLAFKASLLLLGFLYCSPTGFGQMDQRAKTLPAKTSFLVCTDGFCELIKWIDTDAVFQNNQPWLSGSNSFLSRDQASLEKLIEENFHSELDFSVDSCFGSSAYGALSENLNGKPCWIFGFEIKNPTRWQQILGSQGYLKSIGQTNGRPVVYTSDAGISCFFIGNWLHGSSDLSAAKEHLERLANLEVPVQKHKRVLSESRTFVRATSNSSSRLKGEGCFVECYSEPGRFQAMRRRQRLGFQHTDNFYLDYDYKFNEIRSWYGRFLLEERDSGPLISASISRAMSVPVGREFGGLQELKSLLKGQICNIPDSAKWAFVVNRPKAKGSDRVEGIVLNKKPLGDDAKIQFSRNDASARKDSIRNSSSLLCR